MSQLTKELDRFLKSFRERPLAGSSFTYLWLDALMMQCREGGRIVNVACLVAVGVNDDGRREVLGLDVDTAEGGAGWLAFLRGLRLKGVRLVVPTLTLACATPSSRCYVAPRGSAAARTSSGSC